MRVRYWRLGVKDVLNSTYPVKKANHWDIKCLQGEYEHFGVFWFRYGTPFDKELINGICFYYNDIPQDNVQRLLDFLKEKYGGNALFRQSRAFLQGSKEFCDKNEIANLANEISTKFNGPIEITLEFEKVTPEEQEQNKFNFPSEKLLPIAGSDAE
ncbi:MAG: hypothetical protein WCD19_05030 [Nitrososphaeraceae archaeon]